MDRANLANGGRVPDKFKAVSSLINLFKHRQMRAIMAARYDEHASSECQFGF